MRNLRVFLIVVPLLTFLFLAITCRHLKYSSYFYMSLNDVNEHILVRTKNELLDGEIYFKNRNPNDSLVYYESLNTVHPSDFAIMIITKQRPEGHDYLKLVLKNLDLEIKNNPQIANSRFGVIICNTNVPPNAHKLAQYMSQYFPMISIHGDDEEDYRGSHDPTHNERSYKIDYVRCLEQTLMLDQFNRAKHILVLEDDVVPNIPALRGGWLHKMRLVHDILEGIYSKEGAFSLVKLFEPDRCIYSNMLHEYSSIYYDWHMYLRYFNAIFRFKGFGFDWKSFYEITALSFILALTSFCIIHKIWKRKFRNLNNVRTKIIFFAYLWGFILISIWTIGRQHTVLPLRYGFSFYHVGPAPGPYTQGIQLFIRALTWYANDECDMSLILSLF